MASQSAYVTPTAEGAVRPTDNPMVLPETTASDDEVDPGQLALQNMDLSQAADGSALQMTTVLTADQIDTIFLW